MKTADIVAHQAREAEFFATSIGKAFARFERTLGRAWQIDSSDTVSNKRMREVWEQADLARAELRAEIVRAPEEALRQERIEIARMLEAEADKHTSAARELRENYDRADIADEAWAHDCDAATLNRWAERIRGRTPAEPAEPVEPEPVF